MSEGIPLHGDRAAWDTVTYATEHAKGIDDGALLRHLAAPATAGKVMIDQGTEWQAKTISGDATLAADGTLTVASLSGVGNEQAITSLLALVEAELDFTLSRHIAG